MYAYAYDAGMNPSADNGANEFGVYKFVRALAAGNPTGAGKPDVVVTLTTSSVNYSSNAPYKVGVNITDLRSGANTIDCTYVQTMGGYLSWTNFTDDSEKLYYYGDVGQDNITDNMDPGSTQYNGQRKIVRDSNNNISVTYIKANEIWVANSSDDGSTWTYTQLTFGSISVGYPTLAIDSSDDLHLAYKRNSVGTPRINYRTKPPGGVWGPEITVSDPSWPWQVWTPAIAIDQTDEVFVAYGKDTAASGESRIFANNTAGGQVWQTEFQISNAPPMGANWEHMNVSIGFDQNNDVHLVWDNGSMFGTSPNQLWYRNSIGGWGAPEFAITQGSQNKHPCMAVDSTGQVHIVYENLSAFGWEVAYRLPPWAFGQITILSRMDMTSSRNPTIAIDDQDYMYVIWHENRSGNWEMYNRNWINKWLNINSITAFGDCKYPNARWSFYNDPYVGSGSIIDYVYTRGDAPTNNLMYDKLYLGYDAGQAAATVVNESTDPLATKTNGQRKVVRDSVGTIYSIFLNNTGAGDRVYVARSSDQGASWTTGANPVAPSNSDYPAMAIDQFDILWVTYADIPGARIILANSSDGGDTWNIIGFISTIFTLNISCLAIDSTGNVHVVWMEWVGAPGTYQLYYGWYNPFTTTWNPGPQIDGPSTSWACYPSIAVDGNDNVHVSWTERDAINSQIWYTNSTTGWTPTKVTQGPWVHNNSCIATTPGGSVHIVWQNGTWIDHVGAYKGIPTMPYMVNTGGGFFVSPSIAFDENGFIYVAWFNKNPGARDIYYRRFSVEWETEQTIPGSNSNVWPSLRWSYYNNPLTGNKSRIDMIYMDQAPAPRDDILYNYIDAPVDYYWSPLEDPLDTGFYTNGTVANQELTTHWRLWIPNGTPEGAYTTKVYYTLTPIQ
jgi:hypothetical protein